MAMVGGATRLTFWESGPSGELVTVLWTGGVGSGLISMVVFQAARREAFAVRVVQWFAGLEAALGEVGYPLESEDLRSLAGWVAGLFTDHAGWVLLIRAPGILIRGEVAREQYLRIISDTMRGDWDVGWAESFLRDLLEGDARRNGVVISLPDSSGEARSLLCWMGQSASGEVGVGIVIALPIEAEGSRGLIPGVMTAALDMIVHRLGSLLAEVIHRKSRLGGGSPHDPLLLVRALVHELSGELHPTLVYLDGQGKAAERSHRELFRKLRSMLTKSGYWVDLLRDVPVVHGDFLNIGRNRVRLVPVLQQMVEEIRPAWPDCVFRLGLNGDSEVLGDEHLRSVIRNVLFNAASFSPSDGLIDVRVREDGLYARIYIDDEGPGVSADRVEAIFDPHAPPSGRKDDLNTRIRQGMGIGLSIARTIVRGYGGDLRCHANGSGGGGRFEIMLPLAPVEEQEDIDVG
jgi:signal transduction histidine kinase